MLNGCYSEEQAKAIVQDINYVIGMRKAIGDRAAIQFAVGFYDALGAGESIEFAYKLGCAAIRLQGIEEQLTPVLLKKPEVVSTSPPPVNPLEKRAIEIFFSYAHEDEDLRKKLEKHLILMQRHGIIKAWHDHDIKAGDDSESEIEKHLDSAQIILLLISDDFIFSEELWERDVTRAMQRHEAKEARVIPVILRPVDWKDAPFGRLQPLPRNRQAVTNWANQDEAFTEIAKDIRQVVTSWYEI